MENEELMKTTEYDEAEDTEETEKENNSRPSLSLVVGLMAIGSGLTLAGAAGMKKLKKVMAEHKAKKEAAKNAPEVIDVETVAVDPAEEQKPAAQAEEAEE